MPCGWGPRRSKEMPTHRENFLMFFNHLSKQRLQQNEPKCFSVQEISLTLLLQLNLIISHDLYSVYGGGGLNYWPPSPPRWVLKMSWKEDIWKSPLGQLDCSEQENVCSVDSTASGFRASCWAPPRDTVHVKIEPWECTACTVSTLQASSSHCTMWPSPLYPQKLCNLPGVLKGNKSQISSDQGPYRPHFPFPKESSLSVPLKGAHFLSLPSTGMPALIASIILKKTGKGWFWNLLFPPKNTPNHKINKI